MNKLAGNFLICWLGWGIPMGLLFSVMFAFLQMGMLSGIAAGLPFCSHNDFVYSRPVFPER